MSMLLYWLKTLLKTIRQTYIYFLEVPSGGVGGGVVKLRVKGSGVAPGLSKQQEELK